MAAGPLSCGNVCVKAPSAERVEERVPHFLRDTIHLLLPCGSFLSLLVPLIVFII